MGSLLTLSNTSKSPGSSIVVRTGIYQTHRKSVQQGRNSNPKGSGHQASTIVITIEQNTMGEKTLGKAVKLAILCEIETAWFKYGVRQEVTKVEATS